MGSTLIRWALRVRPGSLLLLALPLFPLAVSDFIASQAAELSDTHLEILAGRDWNQWQNDRKVVFIDGFIS